jgi:multidrug resistance protein, MATE family
MLILAFSIPLHLLYIAGTYFLEAIKKPGISTAVMWAANAVNLALNLWWVPEHGAVGSAWATVGARVFLAGVLLAWIFLLRDGVTYGVRKAKDAKGPTYGALLAVGAAAAVSQAVEAGAFSAMTVIAGRISADVVAAYQILLNLMAFVFMIALGLSAATAVLVSEAIGRKAPLDAARAGWTGIALNAIAMIIAAIAMLVFADEIGRVYTADVALASLIASLIWVAAIALHPDGAQVVIASALRARSDNWFPTFSHILAYAVVMPILGYWLAEHQGMGVAGLLFAIFWASVVSAAVLIARWWALTRVKASHTPGPGLAEGQVRDP